LKAKADAVVREEPIDAKRKAEVAEASAQLAESLLLHYDDSEFPALLALIELARPGDVIAAIRKRLAECASRAA
jgi:hypothetical protein